MARTFGDLNLIGRTANGTAAADETGASHRQAGSL
jgi:hypothetical protein